MNIDKSLCRHNEFKQICKWYIDGNCILSIADNIAPCEKLFVLCKDCKKGRQIDKTKSPEKYFKDDCVVCECEDTVGDEPMIYPPFHFCSYGERK